MSYEKRIKNLEEQKLILSEKSSKSSKRKPDFDKSVRTALEFLANPHKLWASDRLEDKRTALKLLFSDKLAYDRKGGFRTAPIAQPFRLLGDIGGGGYEMARPRGVYATFQYACKPRLTMVSHWLMYNHYVPPKDSVSR